MNWSQEASELGMAKTEIFELKLERTSLRAELSALKSTAETSASTIQELTLQIRLATEEIAALKRERDELTRGLLASQEDSGKAYGQMIALGGRVRLLEEALVRIKDFALSGTIRDMANDALLNPAPNPQTL